MFTYYVIKHYYKEIWSDEMEDILDYFAGCALMLLVLMLAPFILMLDILIAPLGIITCITYLIKKRRHNNGYRRSNRRNEEFKSK